MTVYYSDKAVTNSAGNPTGVVPKWKPSGTITVVASATIGSGVTIANADYIVCQTIPANCTVTEVILDCPDLDGSTSLTVSVGDATNAARFITASTVGRAGGVARADTAGYCYKYTSDTPLRVTFPAGNGSATPAAGTVKLVVSYSADV